MFKTRVGEAIDEGNMQLYAEMDPSQRYGRVSSLILILLCVTSDTLRTCISLFPINFSSFVSGSKTRVFFFCFNMHHLHISDIIGISFLKIMQIEAQFPGKCSIYNSEKYLLFPIFFFF